MSADAQQAQTSSCSRGGGGGTIPQMKYQGGMFTVAQMAIPALLVAVPTVLGTKTKKAKKSVAASKSAPAKAKKSSKKKK
jgi:hypothetical protein